MTLESVDGRLPEHKLESCTLLRASVQLCKDEERADPNFGWGRVRRSGSSRVGGPKSIGSIGEGMGVTEAGWVLPSKLVTALDQIIYNPLLPDLPGPPGISPVDPVVLAKEPRSFLNPLDASSHVPSTVAPRAERVSNPICNSRLTLATDLSLPMLLGTNSLHKVCVCVEARPDSMPQNYQATRKLEASGRTRKLEA